MSRRSFFLIFSLATSLAASLAIGGGTIPAFAQPAPLPTPDRSGDYRQTDHQLWIVIDPDANGLNCRWSRMIPSNWDDPSIRLPRMNIRDWSIVRRFMQNTVLVANTSPAGFVTFQDEDNKPWLKVRIGAENQICLVRANRDFIRPIR
jgi:hypothetical protein